MESDVTVEPVLFVKQAPIVGSRVPLCNPPSARSVEPAEPKLYVSPALLLPVPAVYVVFALASDSEKAQPSGQPGAAAFDVPLEARVLKSCVYALPMVVSETHWAVRRGATRRATNNSRRAIINYLSLQWSGGRIVGL